MFRKRDRQTTFLESSYLLPEEKVKRLEKTWAQQFRDRALPLIDEDPFRVIYHPDNGRPNAPVEVVLGVLLLKEMWNLTDAETLEQLEFNLAWQHALRLRPEEAHLCQKTLHNFRVGLIDHDLARVAFAETTDRIIEALGVNTSRQRLDSTHIMSNFAVLTRLGLFCETMRVFMAELRREHPILYGRIPDGLRQRYFRDDESTATRYEDAKSEKARRRLPVCARDLYRLLDLFRGTAAAKLEEYSLLQRLFDEQCQVCAADEQPDAGDDDANDGGVPVQVKEPKEISSDSLQTPHDPDVTYSGHKGKGYEVQVAETCHEDNEAEIITSVEVTASSDSDANATIPTIKGLAERDIQPDELSADTSYGSAENALEAERVGTELVSPVGGGTQAEGPETEQERDVQPLTEADFTIDATGEKPTICPAGHECVFEGEDGNPNRAHVIFDKDTCEACPLFSRCPAEPHSTPGAGYFLRIDLKKANLDSRRRAEASGEFAGRYAIRAGIEATNSELKRRHGLGRLRVRGRPRVVLQVKLKALACNIKRMLRALLDREQAKLATA